MCGGNEDYREQDRREQVNTNTQREVTETKPMIETPTEPQYVVTVEDTDPCAGLHEEELEPVTR